MLNELVYTFEKGIAARAMFFSFKLLPRSVRISNSSRRVVNSHQWPESNQRAEK
jgi:hypothetical protein